MQLRFQTYKDLIDAIPKMSTDKLREIVAHMKLELQLRESYDKNKRLKDEKDES